MKFALLLSSALILVAPAVRAEDALVTAGNAYRAAWDAEPLIIPYATLTTEPAIGYGQYNPRTDDVLKPGEHALIYFEPVGYGFKTDANNFNTFGLTVDLTIAKPDGTVVFSQENFQHLEWLTRVQLHEVIMNLDIGFGTLPAGDYVLNFLVHDENSTETAPFSLPITIKG
jgi:hypothetical protein